MNRLMRKLHGEDLGITAKPLPPARFAERVPYKPGTEKALWPVVPKKPGLVSRLRSKLGI